jgi:2-keto-4-pentenoate hydratase
MEAEASAQAAKLLVEARRSGNLIGRLPEPSRPRNAAEAYEIQLKTVARLGDAIGGWKVSGSTADDLFVGVLLKSLLFEHEATVLAAQSAMRGVEAEIAFRFVKELPARERAYERAEIEAAVIAFPAIEIVDSRFKSYDDTPVIERAADFMSNGAFVMGAERGDWRSFDLSKLEARLVIDGIEVARQVGGHAAGDPLNPAIALCNHFRLSSGVPVGKIVTTGTFTGLTLAGPSSAVQATFVGFGMVGCRFSRSQSPPHSDA